MGALSESSASLRIIGDELIPDEITALLGCEPTKSYQKGQLWYPGLSTRPILANFGRWILSSERFRPGDLDAQIKGILEQLTPDLTIWEALAEKYRVDMFCGLWLRTFNEGISLSIQTMRSLSERHIEIDLDIYIEIDLDIYSELDEEE